MSEELIEAIRTTVLDAMSKRTASPWLDSDGAADYLGCSSGTLKTWRARGEGPRYHVLNEKLVRYHTADLDAFVCGEAA